MKIGIVTSNVEVLTLFTFLTRYNHEYIVYYDSVNAPYGIKNFSTSLRKVEEGVLWLEKQGVNKIIVPPVYELRLFEGGNNKILPIFQNYLLNYVFKFSLVGKIGVVGEFADVQEAQALISNVSKRYQLTENQKNIKKFSFPFNYWLKEESILNCLLRKYSCKSFLMNSLMKDEFRYFKDANVDTVVPLNYSYFNAERTISKFFNSHKTRFHGLKRLEEVFLNLNLEESDYSVSVYGTDEIDSLRGVKKLIWLMQRGKSVAIKWL